MAYDDMRKHFFKQREKAKKEISTALADAGIAANIGEFPGGWDIVVKLTNSNDIENLDALKTKIREIADDCFNFHAVNKCSCLQSLLIITTEDD